MEETIEQLISFGFTQYEAQAYSVLLQNNLLTASELSRLSEIPQGRIYNVLEALDKKGCCTVFPGGVKRYKAVTPKLALASVLKAKEEEKVKLEGFRDALQANYEAIETPSGPIDFIQMLSSKESQINKFDELINASNTTLYSFNKKPYATGFMRNKEEIKKASRPLIKCLKRGVEVRAIFEAETEHADAFLNMVNYYESIGEQVRIVPELPLKMLLSDQETAMVSLRSQNPNGFKLTSMVAEHSDLNNAFTDLFESFWEKGQSIQEYSDGIERKI